jgi:hypothetical protein
MHDLFVRESFPVISLSLILMSAKSFSGLLIPDSETFFQSFLQAESFILGAELRIGVTAYIYDELDTELAKKSF